MFVLNVFWIHALWKFIFLTANESSTLEILQFKVYLEPKIIRFQFPMSKIKTQKEK